MKSARNPNMTLAIPAVDPASTMIAALKEQIQSYLGGPTVVHIDKIKVLLNKKPVPPSKRTVVEALDEKTPEGDVEFGVMIMGGAPDPPPQTETPTPVSAPAGAPDLGTAAAEAQDKKGESSDMEGVESTEINSAPAPVQPGQMSGESVLETTGFWDDLQGFLEQRIRDEAEAARLRGLFEQAWKSSTSMP